jgi:hypothetical protein
VIRLYNAYPNSETAAERALRLSASEDTIQVVVRLPERSDVDHIIVNNLCSNSIFTLKDQQFLIRKTGYTGYPQDIGSLLEALVAFQRSRRKMIHLSTSVAGDLGEILPEQELDAFFTPETQRIRETTATELGIRFDWIGELAPPVYGKNLLAQPDSLEFDGSYGVYFWEMFYHLPLMIAARLNARGKFAQADWWYRRVWDPFSQQPGTPDIVAPGFGFTTPVALPANEGEGLALLSAHADAAPQPFAEIAAADLRLRRAPAALSPRTARAASLRARSLDPDPVEPPAPAMDPVSAFAARDLPVEPDPGPVPFAGAFKFAAADPGIAPEPPTRFAFCVPPDPKLRALRDRVEDRLYKLRHCMNIDGVRRDLASFEAPIDPQLLVRARAAGLDADGIADLLQDDVPVHRFPILLQTAQRFTGVVEALGGKLLQALERKDALALEELQARFEREIVEATERVQRQNRKEAEAARQGVEAAVAAATARRDHYDRLLTGAADPNLGINSNEALFLIPMGAAAIAGVEAAEYDRKSAETQAGPSWGAVLSMGGGVSFGPPGGVANVVATVGFGSVNIAARDASSSAGKRKEAVSAEAASSAASGRAVFERRKADWQNLKAQASAEIAQLERQRDAAALREIIVEREMDLTAERGRQATELLDFYRDRFTDTGLQSYLAGQLSRLHRAAYSRAREMALEAQRAYRFETGDDTFFIAGESWAASRAGLLAGETLTMKLQDMEASYLARARRRHEIALACPLALIDPGALLELQKTGSAAFRVPESFFDMVYPGQYRRRIRSVRVTIPCVAGPLSPVAAKLNLTGSRIARGESFCCPPAQSFYRHQRGASRRRRLFDYEGARTLPFEGAGAADSDWRIELPRELRLVDYAEADRPACSAVSAAFHA